MARRVKRECQACGAACPPRYGIPDPCLGRLPGVRNACCGHGVERYCYVQFPFTNHADRKQLGSTNLAGQPVTLRGEQAAYVLRMLGGNPAPFSIQYHQGYGGPLRGWIPTTAEQEKQ